MLKILGVLALLSTALTGCNENSSGPDTLPPFPIRFGIDSTLRNLSPDSLFVRIVVEGDTVSKVLSYNWKTGTSRGSLTAKEGQAFRVHFEILACDFIVGLGDDSGRFEKDKAIILRVKWDSLAVVKAKLCRMGACIPPDPGASFNLALAGKTFEFPAACDSGVTYRWFVKRGDITLFTGEGPGHSFIIPDSLQGSDITVRMQVVVNGKVKEERTWAVKVIARVTEGRLARVMLKNDPSATEGTSLSFAYDTNGRLAAVNAFDILRPLSGAKSIAYDSLFYDGSGRLKRAVAALPDGKILDSSFRYDDAGNLISLRVAGGSSEILDSLEYQGRRPARSLRFVSGVLRDSVVYRNDADADLDSVFSPGTAGRELVRVIQNLYRRDSLIERRVWINKGGLTPHSKEVVIYNGIGKRGYRQVLMVGQSLTLDRTDIYRYDSLGRLQNLQWKDEVTGEFLFSAEYEYVAKPAAANTAAARDSPASRLSVLGNLRFAHEDWKSTRSPLSRP
jgi:hypothetical protein